MECLLYGLSYPHSPSQLYSRVSRFMKLFFHETVFHETVFRETVL
jgi:hypothetical protein